MTGPLYTLFAPPKKYQITAKRDEAPSMSTFMFIVAGVGFIVAGKKENSIIIVI